MPYWFVPSTYSGRRFGRGIVGYGRIAGGSLYGGVAIYSDEPDMTVMKKAAALAEEGVIPEEEAEKIENAVVTAKPVPIQKKTASLLSGMKNIASKAWNVGKAVYSNPIGRMAINAGLSYLGSTYGPQVAQALANRSVQLGNAAKTIAAPYVEKVSDAARQVGNATMDKLNEGYKTVGAFGQDMLRKGAQNVVKMAAPYAGDPISAARISNIIFQNKKQNDFMKQAYKDAFNIPFFKPPPKPTPAPTPAAAASKFTTLANTAKGLWNRASPKLYDFMFKPIWKRGSGYYGAGRRRGRFVKGSPEAYAYMAMLRARRGVGTRRRSGRGYRAMGLLNFSYPGDINYRPEGVVRRGGMFPGYTYERLKRLYENALKRGDKNLMITHYKKRRTFNKRRKMDDNGYYVTNEDGTFVMEDGVRPHIVMRNNKPVYDKIREDGKEIRLPYPMENIKRMLDGTEKMRKFWTHDGDNLRDDPNAYRREYIASHRRDPTGTWKDMSEKRWNAISRHLNRSVWGALQKYSTLFTPEAFTYWLNPTIKGVHGKQSWSEYLDENNYPKSYRSILPGVWRNIKRAKARLRKRVGNVRKWSRGIQKKRIDRMRQFIANSVAADNLKTDARAILKEMLVKPYQAAIGKTALRDIGLTNVKQLRGINRIRRLLYIPKN